MVRNPFDLATYELHISLTKKNLGDLVYVYNSFRQMCRKTGKVQVSRTRNLNLPHKNDYK